MLYIVVSDKWHVWGTIYLDNSWILIKQIYFLSNTLGLSLLVRTKIMFQNVSSLLCMLYLESLELRLCSVVYITLWPFDLFHLTFLLSSHWLTNSDYAFDFWKLCWILTPRKNLIVLHLYKIESEFHQRDKSNYISIVCIVLYVPFWIPFPRDDTSLIPWDFNLQV